MTPRPAIGQRIREARLRTGLSQTELAGVDISPSYVSLVEHGKRMPSREVLEVLSGRLGVDVRELVDETDEPELAPAVPESAAGAAGPEVRRVDLVSLFMQARKEWEDGGAEAALVLFDAVIETAPARHHEDVLLESRLSVAEILSELGRTDEALVALRALLEGFGEREAPPQLWQRVLISLANLLEQTGRVGEALRHAHTAYLASASGRAQGRMNSLRAEEALVRCSYWTGNFGWVQDLSTDPSPTGVPYSPLLGSIDLHRALVLRDLGRQEAAIEVLASAFSRLKPIDDPHLWGELTSTHAGLLLDARGDQAGARDSLERTRQVMILVGVTEPPGWLTAADAACTLAEGSAAEAVRLAEVVRSAAPGHHPHHLAAQLLAVAPVFTATGHREEAASCCGRAAELALEAGATRYAAMAWKTLAEIRGGAG